MTEEVGKWRAAPGQCVRQTSRLGPSESLIAAMASTLPPHDMPALGPPPRGRRGLLLLLDALGGGTGNHLYAMLRYWDQARWNVGILSHIARTDRRVTPDATVSYLPPRRWYDRYPVGQLHRLIQVRRHVERIRPDLVHAYFSWSIIYARLLKWAGAIRVLVENREDEGFNWGKDEYALLRLTRFLPDRVICVSEAVRAVALAREGLDPAHTLVIHNGIDAPRPASRGPTEMRQAFGFDQDALVVGMVSNLNRAVKGVRNFLDAIPLIRAAVPAARFLIAGRGSEEAALRSQARALGLEPFLVFAGYQEDVDSLYDMMDVSVLTSLSEGLSITMLESMNRGLPVVATRVGGNPELIVDGVTGFLVPPRDARAFAERAITLLRDPVLRRGMGAAGSERVERHFRLANVAVRYQEVYESLLLGGR